MCRFAAYIGPEIFVSSLVTEPKHSIIHQSYHAKERVEPLNGDGFGIGWYAPQFCDDPAIFKEVSPAWNNQNLRNISRVTKSSCIFAHVRAATVGGQVSRSNCHPFTWKKYLFMHNGTVYGFEKIRRLLRRELSDQAYNLIHGNTDSEHIFALFVDLIRTIQKPKLPDLARSLLDTMATIEELKMKTGVTTASTMNLVLSDGQRLIATRYISKGTESNSLYSITGSQFGTVDGECTMEKGKNAVLIVSEPLNDSSRWQKIANNHIIMVDHDKRVSTEEIRT